MDNLQEFTRQSVEITKRLAAACLSQQKLNESIGRQLSTHQRLLELLSGQNSGRGAEEVQEKRRETGKDVEELRRLFDLGGRADG